MRTTRDGRDLGSIQIVCWSLYSTIMHQDGKIDNKRRYYVHMEMYHACVWLKYNYFTSRCLNSN